MVTGKTKLYSGRLMATQKFPYLRAAILGLVPVEVPGLGTFGVSEDMVMSYDMRAVEAWSVEELGFAWIHEAMHVLRKHSQRCAAINGDPEIWNAAADAESNDDLVAAGLKAPSKSVTGKPFKIVLPASLGCKNGGLAEEYYRAAEQQAQQQRAGKGRGGKGAGKGQGNGAGTGGHGDESGDEPVPGCGWCGSGAGREVPGQAGGKASGKGQEAKGPGAVGRSEAEIERIRRQVAEDIQRHAASKGQGSVPGGWVRWADGMLAPPKIPWQQKLARVVRAAVAHRAGAVDFKYTRPSRRQAGLGYGPGVPLLPALRAPIPIVDVAVDTSGSMGDGEIKRAMSEIAGIMASTGAETSFLACDAAVHTFTKVRHWTQLAGLVKGGGGTDFRPVFESFSRKRPPPHIVVFVTDGGGPAPELPPPYQVIWVLVGQHRMNPVKHWPNAEIIEVDE